MSISKSRFTVAKLDAGMAILLTSDHHLIEFPSLLLPSGVVAGSIIDLSVAQNARKESEERDAFTNLQTDIRNLFATHRPSTPELAIRNVTQTSVVLEWNLLDLATADMLSLSLYKNGSKLGKIPNATTTTTKLSGLALDTVYTFQLILRTSAGVFRSNELEVRTHKMTNLTGLNICISNIRAEERERLTQVLERIGAKPPHERVRIDTTHFVTNRGMGDEFKKAQVMNIPIVVPDFVDACETEGRIMRVGSYYLDSDPALRSKRTGPPAPIDSRANPSDSTSNPTAGSKDPNAQAMLPVQTTPLTEDGGDRVPVQAAGDAPMPPALTPGSGSSVPVSDNASTVAEVSDSTETPPPQRIASQPSVDPESSETHLETHEVTRINQIAIAPDSTSRSSSQGPSPIATQGQGAAMGSQVEAVQAVEDLPAQLDQHNREFPPAMGRGTTEGDMEDVAF